MVAQHGAAGRHLAALTAAHAAQYALLNKQGPQIDGVAERVDETDPDSRAVAAKQSSTAKAPAKAQSTKSPVSARRPPPLRA